MGVFDLFRKNKNIITDNGLNKIYYDNGKGFIKEQFVKTNGVIDGEFISYERNGTYQKKQYKNGEICLTVEEQLEKDRQEKIYKTIQEQIDNLLALDNLIVKLIHIPFLMQMENPTIEICTKWINDKLGNRFDEELIMFYLFTKRNFYIKELIASGNETKLIDSIFTTEINNYQKRRLTPKFKFEWYNYTLSEQILDKLLMDKNSGIKLECGLSIWGNGISKSIFSQDSVFFGLNYDAYLLIHKVLANSEKRLDKYFLNRSLEKTFKEKSVPENENEEMIIESTENEIISICNKNKLNQEELVMSLY